MGSPDRPLDTHRRRPAGGPAGAAALDLPFDAEGLYSMRAAVLAHAGRLGAADDQAEHVVIVASELASNAVRHGGGGGTLRLWRHDSVLYCQVSDGGPGFADPTVGTTLPDPSDATASRGIWICRSLSEELVIEANRDSPGATVTATIPPPRR